MVRRGYLRETSRAWGEGKGGVWSLVLGCRLYICRRGSFGGTRGHGRTQ